MTQLAHVTEFNRMMLAKQAYTMVMTSGNGSMIDEPRVRGWVVFGENSAKWLPNRKEAELELSVRDN